MFERIKFCCAAFLLVMLNISYAGSEAIAEDALWQVSKSSGDFWVTNSGVQQASLTEGATLKAGATIRTGRNGRVLLTRGEENILISPNSVIGVPAQFQEEPSTTILQQAGSILLEIKKRDVKHFEVVTPYLAAVVKGTQFRVTVNKNTTSVGVLSGQVEVADFKSGQYALVLPGQTAKVSAHGMGGLLLSGSGVLSPLQQGTPRTSPVSPVSLPKKGYSARANMPNISLPKEGYSARANAPNTQPLRITSPLGEVKLDFRKVTKGLSHAPIVSASLARNGERTRDNGLGKAEGNGLASDFGNDLSAGHGNGFGHGNKHGHGPGHGLGHAKGKEKGKGKN